MHHQSPYPHHPNYAMGAPPGSGYLPYGNPGVHTGPIPNLSKIKNEFISE